VINSAADLSPSAPSRAFLVPLWVSKSSHDAANFARDTFSISVSRFFCVVLNEFTINKKPFFFSLLLRSLLFNQKRQSEEEKQEEDQREASAYSKSGSHAEESRNN
jgi:hypothetical protein